MMKLLFLPLALVTTGVTLAQEVGRVISSTPIVQQVAVPRQVCRTEQVVVQQPKSGAGALIGAIAGGAMGNAVGGGTGKAVATMMGVIGGAVVGDSIEGSPSSQFQNIQRCTTQNSYEHRTVAYNVDYEFGGRQYSVQMPSDPGPNILLQVTPIGGAMQTDPPSNNVTYLQPGYQQPTYMVTAAPDYSAYPAYYSQPNNVPVAAAVGVGVGLLIGAQRHGHGYGHSRWR
jgi:uncharacterized protein YcfJ